MKHLVWHPATQLPGLYAIVDLPDPAGLGAEQLARAMAQAAADCRPRVLQLRAKTLSTQQLRAAVVAVADACRGTGVGVVVNDHVELAVSGIPGVVGVHLGQEDLDALGEPVAAIRQLRAQAARAGHEHFCIGVSTHDLAQVRRSRDLAIDYIGFGPVRRTSSKQLAEPVTGFDTLRDACAIARVPVVAIGGLSGVHAYKALTCGVRFVAMIGSLRGATPAEVRDKLSEQTQALRVPSTGLPS